MEIKSLDLIFQVTILMELGGQKSYPRGLGGKGRLWKRYKEKKNTMRQFPVHAWPYFHVEALIYAAAYISGPSMPNCAIIEVSLDIVLQMPLLCKTNKRVFRSGVFLGCIICYKDYIIRI